jgi:phytanoyl-CoA hydroxylase
MCVYCVTVTFSLALDSTTEENGCIRYIPGSGTAKSLWPHKPLGSDRSESHAIVATVGAHEDVQYAPVPRLSASIHDEWVVHGSGDWLTPSYRLHLYLI